MNTMPRPEHPLPQWERSTWKNLNGEWDFSWVNHFFRGIDVTTL